jgi:hypothetical protein
MGQRGRAYSPAAGCATIGRLAGPRHPLGCAQRRWLPPGRCVGGLLWPGRVAPGPGRWAGGLAWTGGRERWTGGLGRTGGLWTTTGGWRQPCQPAGPPQPNPRRHAKPHWYQPGPRQPEGYQQYLRPPQKNCAFSMGEASASEASGANAPTPSAASAGRTTWEINPAMARDRASLRNMCGSSDPPRRIVDGPLEPPMNGPALF